MRIRRHLTTIIFRSRFGFLLIIPGALLMVGGSNRAMPPSPLLTPQTSARSLSLDGLSYVELPTSQSAGTNITGSITIEAWIKMTRSDSKMAIIERWTPGSVGGYELRIAKDGTDPPNVRFALHRNGTLSKEVGSPALSSINANQWYHVAGIFNSSTMEMRLYIDGVLKANQSIAGFNYNGGSAKFRIGARSDSLQKFVGLIDDVRITAGVVYAQNFARPFPPLPLVLNTKGLWQFDNSDLTDSAQINPNLIPNGNIVFSSDVPQPPLGNSNNSAFVAQSVPTAMVAGQTYNVWVTMRNTGSNTWRSDLANYYALGTQNPQDNTVFGNTPLAWGRIAVPGLTEPGTEVTFNFQVTAPGTPGTYHFQRRMVQHGVEWFGASTPEVLVNVTGASVPPPTVTVSTSGGPFNSPANITINANATAGSGRTINKVEFYNAATNVKLGEDPTAPYSLQWRSVPAGSYTIKARAIDSALIQGEATTPVTVSDNAPGTMAFLSNLSPVTTPVNGFGPLELDMSNGHSGALDGQTIQLNGIAYAKGLGAHAVSEVRYSLVGGNYVRFVAEIGVDDEMGSNGSVDFQVFADADPTPLYNSRNVLGRAMTGLDATLNVDVNITGRSTLILRVTDGGLNGIDSDHADWAGARLIRDTNPPPPPPPSGDNLAVERIDPVNRTGRAGEDLYSGNYNWNLPIVGLPGRAGLDLDLSLTYNSLVWTRSLNGGAIKFDADRGFPSPGFRLGLPVIQLPKYTSQAGTLAYLMIMPSGKRVELRQVSGSIYESVDSSYIQFNEATGLALVSDGTQLSYMQKGVDLQCVRIKDRNGNFIDAGYDSSGSITSIVDTLGRVINFEYVSGNLNAIWQLWNGVRHDWATFTYNHTQPLSRSFNISTVTAPAEFSALTSVTLADASSYVFEYSPFGQVNKITHRAPDTHTLSSTSYDMNGSVGQTDCPRFTRRTDFAENWFTVETDFVFDRGVVGLGQMILPDDKTMIREYHHHSDFRKGLTTQVDTFFEGIPKKTVRLIWEQDGTGSQPTNPRVIETQVTDDMGNGRTTSVNYTNFGLPSDVCEKDISGNILRKTHTDYNFDAAYTSRRILGLPAMVQVWEGDGAVLVSKVRYGYDWTDFFLVATDSAPTNHDPLYNNTFILGRGNLSGIQRFDVTDPDNSLGTAIWVSQIGHFITGTTRFVRDANWRGSDFSYTDSFSDGANRSTFAYPTQVTNPDGYTTFAEYNFNIGEGSKLRMPGSGTLAAANVTYHTMTAEYDNAGRVAVITDQNNGAYVRFEYLPSLTKVNAFRTLQALAGEAHETYLLDGLGRVRASVSEFPGSTGGYRAQTIAYDILGRIAERSLPTEVTLSGNVLTPAGDDSGNWRLIRQEYDWQNRPTITRNLTDGTRKLFEYGGCGCAGGDTVTFTDELDRQQRSTHDVLGRVRKIEIFDTGSVYSTSSYEYNARDQLTRIVESQGSSLSGQETLMTFDGHGRLKTRKIPAEVSVDGSPGMCQYNYNLDDTLQSETDARGAVTTYSYNNRKLLTGLTYTNPNNVVNIDPAPPVTYEYDAAGHRTLMLDGVGRVDYLYNNLGQLTSETRKFRDISRSHTLLYTYSLSGQLASIEDPFGSRINYAYDKVGQLTGVTGTPYAGVTQYASNVRYRAWGSVKSLTYGNNRTLSINYNQRLQPSRFEVPGVTAATFQYYADGSVRYVGDLLDPRHDRGYKYDHMGRLTEAVTGEEARTPGAFSDGPYRETLRYDVWSNMTERTGVVWDTPLPTHTATYVNNRNTAPGWRYDAAGNVTRQENQRFTYDAAGQQTSSTIRRRVNNTVIDYTTTQKFDGDGFWVKQDSRYLIRSTLLDGEVVAQVDSSGNKSAGYVYLGGVLLARQIVIAVPAVHWVHQNPATSGRRYTDASGVDVDGTEFEPLGAEVGREAPKFPPDPDEPGPNFPDFYKFVDLAGGCTIDGMLATCSQTAFLESTGAGVNVGSMSTVAGIWSNSLNKYVGLALFDASAYADGAHAGGLAVGWVPLGWRYVGDGYLVGGDLKIDIETAKSIIWSGKGGGRMVFNFLPGGQQKQNKETRQRRRQRETAPIKAEDMPYPFDLSDPFVWKKMKKLQKQLRRQKAEQQYQTCIQTNRTRIAKKIQSYFGEDATDSSALFRRYGPQVIFGAVLGGSKYGVPGYWLGGIGAAGTILWADTMMVGVWGDDWKKSVGDCENEFKQNGGRGSHPFPQFIKY